MSDDLIDKSIGGIEKRRLHISDLTNLEHNLRSTNQMSKTKWIKLLVKTAKKHPSVSKDKETMISIKLNGSYYTTIIILEDYFKEADFKGLGTYDSVRDEFVFVINDKEAKQEKGPEGKDVQKNEALVFVDEEEGGEDSALVFVEEEVHR